MSEHGELPLLDAAIFADTGSEPSYVYTHLEWLLSVVQRIPVYRVSTGNLGHDMLAILQPLGEGRIGQSGHPPFYVQTSPERPIGMLWRRCTKDYKIVPIERKLRELCGYSPRQRMPKEPIVEQWKGISVEELQRASCSRQRWIFNRYPLIEQRMRRHDCIHWMHDHGFPEPPKSACVFCPYRSNAGWRSMREREPDDFQAAIAFDDALRAEGKRIPGTQGHAYVHRSAVPLRLVNFDNAEDEGQQNLFAREECAGVCGV